MGVNGCLQCPPYGKYMYVTAIGAILIGMYLLFLLAGARMGDRDTNVASNGFLATFTFTFAHFQLVNIYMAFNVKLPELSLHIVQLINVPFSFDFFDWGKNSIHFRAHKRFLIVMWP